MPLRTHLAALAVAACCLGLAADLRAGSDGSLRWQTLESAHFHIHFYQGEEPLAREFLAIAEEAYEELEKRFGFEPTERTHLVVVDDVDSANGLTMVVPYNHVVLYAYLPDAAGELGFWGDWKRILVYHELTHVFHLERVTGIFRIVNAIVGKTFLPNGAVPDWVTEGLAVNVESSIDSGGRIGSPLYSTYLRLAILEDSWLELDEVTGSPLALPRGSTPYLYGSYFVRWLAERFGVEKLTEYVEEQGGKFNPLSHNISARRIFGETFVHLYEEWHDALAAQVEAEMAPVRAAGIREGKRLAFASEYGPMPSWTDQGTLLWNQADGREVQRLAERLPDGTVRTLGACRGGCDRPTERDGRIFFASFQYLKTYYYYQDLMRLDREGGRTRLTEGRRTKDPSPSPDGSRIAYVSTVLGKARVEVAEADGQKPRTVYEGRGGLSWPSWSPDGNWLVFSEQQGGHTDLLLLELTTGELRNLTPGASVELHPTFAPDGRHVVFSSSRSGIYNLYAMDLSEGCTRQLTNVVGAAWMPTVHPDGDRVAYASYHSDGYWLHEVPLLDPACEPLDFAAPPPHPSPGAPPPAKPAELVDEEPSRYNAVKHCYPRQWRPSFFAADANLTVWGLETWGNDPVGHLSYTLSGQYNTDTGDGSATASLSIDAWYPAISLFGGYYRSTLWAKANDAYQDYRESDWYGSLALTFPFRQTGYSFSLSAGYAFEHFTGGIIGPWEFDPGSTEPYFPEEGNLGSVYTSLSFDNTESYGYSVTTEQGWQAATEMRLSSPIIGSNWTEYQVKWRLTRYNRLYFLDHHVVKLGYRGGWAGGRETFLRKFGIGGYPDQDIFADLLDGVGMGGNYLRGYPPGVMRGRQYHYGSLDYFFPLWRIRRGWQTFPIFIKDLYVDLFGNGAAAFDEFDIGKFLWGAGAELRLKILVSYNLPFTLTVGTAYGFQEPGEFQTYFLLGQ